MMLALGVNLPCLAILAFKTNPELDAEFSVVSAPGSTSTLIVVDDVRDRVVRGGFCLALAAGFLSRTSTHLSVPQCTSLHLTAPHYTVPHYTPLIHRELQ